MDSVFSKELPKKRDHNGLRRAVCQVVDLIEAGTEFTSFELKDSVARLYPQYGNVFLETVMRYVRFYRRQNVICVSKAQSKYRKIEKEIINE